MLVGYPQLKVYVLTPDTTASPCLANVHSELRSRYWPQSIAPMFYVAQIQHPGVQLREVVATHHAHRRFELILHDYSSS